jgi:hypothetical protein
LHPETSAARVLRVRNIFNRISQQQFHAFARGRSGGSKFSTRRRSGCSNP